MRLAKPTQHWPEYNRQDFLARGLVGFWPMWEGAGSIVQDLVNGNDGTLDGPTWGGSAVGTALSYAVNGQHVLVPTTPTLEPEQITVMCLAQTNNPSGALNGGIAAGTPFGTLDWRIDFNSSAVRMSVDTVDSPTGVQVTVPLTDTKFHHYGFTYDLARIKSYKDGVQVQDSAQTGAIVYNSLPIRFGRQTNFSLDGRISYVAMWDRALTESEFAAIGTDWFRLIRPGVMPSVAAIGVARQLVNDGLVNAPMIGSLVG